MYFSCEPRRENRLDEKLAVSGIYSRMVQDSLKAGPEVLNLRSLNLWRVLPPFDVGCEMYVCILFTFILLSKAERVKSHHCLDQSSNTVPTSCI